MPTSKRSNSLVCLSTDKPHKIGQYGNDIPTIGVLLSAYNGAKFIIEQLDSIYAQKGVRIHLVIRDDGSSDNTVDLVEQYATEHENPYVATSCIRGENIGFLRSFEWLLNHASGCSYYAFADQDDYWQPYKLLVAITALENEKGPALYASTTTNTDEYLNILGKNEFPGFTYSLESEIVRHRLSAHTMVWNSALHSSMGNVNMLPCWSHDQYLTIASLIFGGRLLLDQSSYVLHRRLRNSLTPGGRSLKKRLNHEWNMIKDSAGTFNRAELASALLDEYADIFDESTSNFLQNCVHYHDSTMTRLLFLVSPSVSCGLILGNLEARLAILLGTF